jgi:hypothetical protein
MTRLGTNSGGYASNLWKGRGQGDVLSHVNLNTQVLTELDGARSWFGTRHKFVQRAHVTVCLPIHFCRVRRGNDGFGRGRPLT